MKQYLRGMVDAWGDPKLDLDALVTPLGLSGPYKVFGIDHPDDNKIPLTPDGTPQESHEWWERLQELQAFTISVTPNMTVLHLVRLAALEDLRRNGRRIDGHIFFERVHIGRKNCVIEFTMGS